MTAESGGKPDADSPAGVEHSANRGAPPSARSNGFVARLGPRGHGLLQLLILLLVAVLSLYPLFPRSIMPASGPGDRFSGERAMVHLSVIAREAHPAGSKAQARVKQYLIEQLSALGLQPAVQQAPGVENVVARLAGTDSSGAIVLLSHYDSDPAGPGAGDNGSGVAALLEIMRALAKGPTLRNDVIVLFDDGEEEPDPYTGARMFVLEHPWMADVRVVISMDSAVRGPISTNEIGPENGFVVQALARAYTGGAWTSASGGGGYDYTPFREAGVQGLVLEDNYPFKEKHTGLDRPQVVGAASVQQLGEQTLAITRELGRLDLSDPRDRDETWFSVSPLGLVHYPRSWTLPLAIAAAISMVLALGLALWRKFASWRGLAAALGMILVTTALAGIAVGALMTLVPGLLQWDTASWPDWPEVDPAVRRTRCRHAGDPRRGPGCRWLRSRAAPEHPGGLLPGWAGRVPGACDRPDCPCSRHGVRVSVVRADRLGGLDSGRRDGQEPNRVVAGYGNDAGGRTPDRAPPAVPSRGGHERRHEEPVDLGRDTGAAAGRRAASCRRPLHARPRPASVTVATTQGAMEPPNQEIERTHFVRRSSPRR